MSSTAKNFIPSHMTTAEAASYLSLSRKQLEAWRLRGDGPRFAKIGRSVRYRRVDLDDFVEARLVTSTSDADTRKGGE